MSEDGKRRVDLLEQFNKHPGKRIMDALLNYGGTKNVLAGNALQLRHLILLMEDIADPLKISPLEQRAKLQGLFGEVYRLFHNFLASMKTLVDHTRNLVNEDFVVQAHRSEHESHVQSAFANDPLTRFIQEFRNYVLHHAVPKIELTHHIVPAPERIELNIDAVDMLRYYRWGSLARTYLEQHKPKLRVLNLVDEYEGKARTFHHHFVLRFHHFYGTDLLAAEALMREWNEGLRP